MEGDAPTDGFVHVADGDTAQVNNRRAMSTRLRLAPRNRGTNAITVLLAPLA